MKKRFECLKEYYIPWRKGVLYKKRMRWPWVKMHDPSWPLASLPVTLVVFSGCYDWIRPVKANNYEFLENPRLWQEYWLDDTPVERCRVMGIYESGWKPAMTGWDDWSLGLLFLSSSMVWGQFILMKINVILMCLKNTQMTRLYFVKEHCLHCYKTYLFTVHISAKQPNFPTWKPDSHYYSIMDRLWYITQDRPLSQISL